MKVSTINFPSIFEAAFGNTENSAKDLLNGIKLKSGESWYLVGNLAKRTAINAGRIINASPDEEAFDILFRSAMIQVVEKREQPFVITTGLPLSTYNIYKPIAEQYLGKRHFLLSHDTNTYNINGSVRKNTFEIDRYEVIPEIVASIIGLKKTIPDSEQENIIVLNFGFGTVEGAMATTEGLVHRTTFSSHGIRYVIGNLTRELSQKYNLEMKNEHKMDDSFAQGSLFTQRRKINLLPMRKELLTHYFKGVISPLLRKHFTDNDLESCNRIYIMGGGSHYKELTDMVADEFAGFIPVVIVPNPKNMVSIGYLFNSLRISDGHPNRCLGIDLGNASTAISFFEA